MNQGIHSVFQKAFIWNFQYPKSVKFRFDLHLTQISIEEIHNGIELMKQVALDFHVMHFIAERCTAYRIADETNAFGGHSGKPTLSMFAE